MIFIFYKRRLLCRTRPYATNLTSNRLDDPCQKASVNLVWYIVGRFFFFPLEEALCECSHGTSLRNWPSKEPEPIFTPRKGGRLNAPESIKHHHLTNLFPTHDLLHSTHGSVGIGTSPHMTRRATDGSSCHKLRVLNKRINVSDSCHMAMPP